MTTPGYPDWERLVRAGGDPVLTVNQNITTTLTKGPFNVQQWSSIMMFALSDPAGDVYQINWLWYADKGETQLLSSIFQVLGPNNQLPINVPVAGPWLVIQIVPKAGGIAKPVVITLFGMASSFSTWAINTYSSALVQDFTNYSAGESLTFFGADEFYGAVILSVIPDHAAIVNIDLQTYVWSSGAMVPLVQAKAIFAPDGLVQRIALPAAHWQLTIINGTTQQDIYTSMMPSP